MKWAWVLMTLLWVPHAIAGETSVLKFEELGFQIQAIEGKSEAVISLPLMMCLPPADGFAPNVVVLVQPTHGSMEEFKALTEKEIEKENFKLIRSSITAGIYEFEYTRADARNHGHSYSRAIKRDGFVYVATGNALEIQWEQYKERLVRAVESFKFIE
jgi:hypothetical protein